MCDETLRAYMPIDLLCVMCIFSSFLVTFFPVVFMSVIYHYFSAAASIGVRRETNFTDCVWSNTQCRLKRNRAAIYVGERKGNDTHVVKMMVVKGSIWSVLIS